MEIYLFRHTTPDIAPGTCYGWHDMGTVHTFEEEARRAAAHLPEAPLEKIYCSPLKRCRLLGEYLFPDQELHFDDRLKEIHCGDWEGLPWDAIDKEGLRRWMDNLIEEPIPGGESYRALYDRTTDFWQELLRGPQERVAIVAHGGVLRSLLAHIEGVDLRQSFEIFSLRYGCVVRVTGDREELSHEVLHNPDTGQERHRPKVW